MSDYERNAWEADAEYIAARDTARESLLEEMRCKNCRHWLNETRLGPDGYGECQANVFVESMARDRQSTSQVVYDYDEGGGFSTGPDFGCIHFEAKT